MNMGRFDKYKGLFADNGDFDIPSHYSLGVAFTPTPAWTVALDFGRINYSGVALGRQPELGATAPLGAANGPGFGWKDIDVVKLGVRLAHEQTPGRCAPATTAATTRSAASRRDLQHPRPGRDEGALHGRLHLGAGRGQRDHRRADGCAASNRERPVAVQCACWAPVRGGNETIACARPRIGLAWSHKF